MLIIELKNNMKKLFPLLISIFLFAGCDPSGDDIEYGYSARESVLSVEDGSGTPNIPFVRKINFSPGTVTNNGGGEITVTTGATTGSGIDLTAAGLGGPILHWIMKQFLPVMFGGFFGPGYSLSINGDYNTRGVENMEFGPSFMWLESCICGKIDGMYPKANIGQTLLHAGVTSLVVSPTGSNIAGGYIEPKNRMYDTPFAVNRVKRRAFSDAKQGVYPEPHFGYKMYTDLCDDLRINNVSVGMAFRNARNKYLPEDADWELWWSPPLVTTGNFILDNELMNDMYERIKSTSSGGKGPMLENKYITYQEYLLFGDPAFNPYEPVNEGS